MHVIHILHIMHIQHILHILHVQHILQILHILHIPHICHFFTQAEFLENKIFTEKRVNYDKLHSTLPILRVNYYKLHRKLPIFAVKSVKIYTGQKKFTPPPPVTNMRYDSACSAYSACSTHFS